MNQTVQEMATMNNIGLEATSITSGDVHPLGLWTLLVLLTLVVMIGILSSRALRLRSQTVGNLFLKICFACKGQSFNGFVRTLDPSGASLVSNYLPEKGQELNMDLSSLPDFPNDKTVAHAVVSKVRRLGGNPQNYLIEVTFDDQLKETFQAPLERYLKHLLA